MHVLSKVLLGVVVVMAIVAVILTSKLRLARGHWLEQVEQREEKLETLQEDLRKKRLLVAAARDEVNRLMVNWGRTWPAQGQVVNPQTGAIAINVGGNSGLGRRELEGGAQLPSIYAFAVSPQGTDPNYLGEFRLTEVQADRASAQLTRLPYQGEPQSWPAGPMRIRESIPSHWRAIFTGLDTRTAEALQDAQDQQARLQMADELIGKSQEQLQRRLAQLEGSPNAIEGSSPEVINGLVASLRSEETDRNTKLGRLDDLRHEYDRKYRRLLQMVDENRELEMELPQPGADVQSPQDNPQQASQTSAQPAAAR